jgi:type I restriction enzyme, S subunit
MSSRDWHEIRLGDVANILSGYAFKSNDFVDNGIPVIKIKNINPPIIDISDVQNVTEELYKEKERYALQYNDILISLTGSGVNQIASAVGKIGRVRIRDKRLLLNQRVGKLFITNKEKCNYDFLYYYLIQDDIRYSLAASAGGSANQANISPAQIKSLKINLPPLTEQKEIAKILSSLDEKIETNNQINKKLEEMAQTIFKQWFVDFEFPNEDGEPYKSSGGEMVESELGMIPKGWKFSEATELFNVQSGGTPKTGVAEYWKGEIPFFTPKDSHITSVFVLNTEKSITQEGLSNCNSKLYSEGTVFITARGTVGNIAMAGRKMAMNQSCYALVPKEGFTCNYIYFLIIQLVNILKMNASGSVFDAIIVSTFSNLKTVIPNKEIVQKYDLIVKNLFSCILNNINENERLEKIRNTLLPKLMSGEIRVPIES